MMKAHPDCGPFLEILPVSTPASRSFSISHPPRSSSPTCPNISQSIPKSAAWTIWLELLPPGLRANPSAAMVLPGSGKEATENE